jgi:hypothetical protein
LLSFLSGLFGFGFAFGFLFRNFRVCYDFFLLF